MIYIENYCNDPRYNLAFEEYVFNNICDEEPVLLLWQNAPSVIIGKYQNTVEEINTDYIEKNDIHVVRRITGGGAVYHDLGNLNYSFVVPNVNAEIDFKTFSLPVIKALKKLGIEAEQTGRNDITTSDGRKFSGNAQFYNKKGLLHHGTIMFDVQLDTVQAALAVKPGKIESKGIKSVRSRVTNIRPYIKEDMTVKDFKEYLLKEFFESGDVKVYELTETQLAEIRKLSDEKYMTWEWNYGHSPQSNIKRSKYFAGGYVELLLDVQEGIIRNLKVYGDFFGHKDISVFEEAFNGKQYSRQSIEDVLANMDTEDFFHNITKEEITELLY